MHEEFRILREWGSSRFQEMYLVHIHEVWQEEDTCVVIEEFVNGSTVSEYMQSKGWNCMPPEMALAFAELWHECEKD